MDNNVLEKLVEETLDISRNESPTINPGSDTVALYKSVTNLIYKELVNITETKDRVANIFCWEHVDANNKFIVNTPATYSGMFGTKERQALKDDGKIFPSNTSYTKGDYFVDEDDIVYQATIDNPFDGLTASDDEGKIAEAFFYGKIRYVSDASKKEGFEPTESAFRMKSWRGNVNTRRTKIEATTELVQDMSSYLGESARQKIIDSIATVIADDINKDIIHKLLCVSTKLKIAKYDFKPVADFSDDKRDDYIIGRELYALATEMMAEVTSNTKFTPSYVVASPRVAGKINSSGLSIVHSADKLKSIQDRYILNDGTLMLVDATAKFDYIMVGIKNANASSLYLSNFVKEVAYKGGDKFEDSESTKLGTYNIFRVTNPNSMSDSYMCMSRYALTSPPYTFGDNENMESKIVYGDKWEELANKSPLSVMMGVVLPKLERQNG